MMNGALIIRCLLKVLRNCGYNYNIMNYTVTRIIGVKDEVEVVKLSCYKVIKCTPQEYQRKLYDFYDSWGVRLDYVEIETSERHLGKRGGRKAVISTGDLIKFMEDNPTMNQNAIAKHFNVTRGAISHKLDKVRHE